MVPFAVQQRERLHQIQNTTTTTSMQEAWPGQWAWHSKTKLYMKAILWAWTANVCRPVFCLAVRLRSVEDTCTEFLWVTVTQNFRRKFRVFESVQVCVHEINCGTSFNRSMAVAMSLSCFLDVVRLRSQVLNRLTTDSLKCSATRRCNSTVCY